MDKEFQRNMAIVIQAFKQAGYVPYGQLLGYVKTRNLSYITRRDNARELIREMDAEMIREYIQRKSI